MKAAVLFLSSLALLPDALADDAKPRSGRLPVTCEVVMSPGMKITATTSVGTIAVTAADELTRSYTWDGATRSVEMEPQKSRYFGSLGLFFDGVTVHWREHHGIARCSTQEGQQDFKTVEELMKWIKEPERLYPVYRNDGLMVGWYKDLPRKMLDVHVWQILINGKKPTRLPGSQDDKIVVETVAMKNAPLVEAVLNNDLNSVTALLAQGADANVKSNVGIPALLVAIRRESAPMVKALLKRGANPNVRDSDTDWTALLHAIGQIEIAKLLLAAGADVNATSRRGDDLLRGMTPLMLAVLDGNEELVQLLVDKGADVSARAPDGGTALALAKEFDPKNHQGLIRKLEAAMTKRGRPPRGAAGRSSPGRRRACHGAPNENHGEDAGGNDRDHGRR